MRFQLPVLVWMVLIFTLSSLPGSTYAPYSFPDAHLIAHTLLFGMLYYLAYRALKYQSFSRFLSELSLLVSLLFVALYGASDEYHQSFVPGRSEELKDFLVDITSAFVVLLAILVTDRMRPGRKKLRAGEQN